MITVQNGIQITANGDIVHPETYFGMPTDNKPTDGVANGSCFIEMLSSKIYFFDAENTTWIEWGASS